MADNVNVTAGTGTTVAADEVTDATLGTAKVQYVKLMDGTLDGTAKAAVGANGLKVDGSGVTQPVSAASLPLPSGAATESTLAGVVKPFDTIFNISADSSGSGNLTGVGSVVVNLYSSAMALVTVVGTWVGTLQFEGTINNLDYFSLNAMPIPSGAFVTSATANGNWYVYTAGCAQVRVRCSAYTSGTITIYMRSSLNGGLVNLGAVPKVDGSGVTQPVSGTFWQTTQPVSIASMPSTPVTGPLTDTQIRATALPVSGTVTATGPLTDTQLRASAVPVSGTVTASGPLTDTQLRATAVPVSGTVTTTPPSNASTNVAQVAGTTADTNSGLKSAGTLRVVLATDQPALTNKLLVTPDSVALPANQSVNQTQWNGTTIDSNSGLKSGGTLRVVLATDQPALTAKLLVTPDSVALPANQSVNLAQTNGATAVTSVTGVMDVMPRKRTGSTGLSPNYSASHITSNATTTPTAATAYVNTLVISCSGAGTAWTLKVQNKEATPKILVPNFTLTVPSTGLPVILPLAEPVLMTSGIDIITAGTTAGIVDVFVTYWQ